MKAAKEAASPDKKPTVAKRGTHSKLRIINGKVCMSSFTITSGEMQFECAVLRRDNGIEYGVRPRMAKWFHRHVLTLQNMIE